MRANGHPRPFPHPEIMIFGKGMDRSKSGGKAHVLRRDDREAGPASRRIGDMAAKVFHGCHAALLLNQANGKCHTPRNTLACRLLHRCYGICPGFKPDAGEGGVHQRRKIHRQALGQGSGLDSVGIELAEADRLNIRDTFP